MVHCGKAVVSIRTERALTTDTPPTGIVAHEEVFRGEVVHQFDSWAISLQHANRVVLVKGHHLVGIDQLEAGQDLR